MSAKVNFFEEHSESIASRVAVGLSKLGLAMKSQAWADAGERGLTPTQGQILALLRSRRLSALRLSQVAELLAISAPTASDSVRALVNKGLVRKSRAQGDARAIALELTEVGAQEAERAASWPDFLLCAIQSLSAQEQHSFLIALIKIIGVLTERGRIPQQRMCVTCRYFRANESPEPDGPYVCGLYNERLAARHLRIDCPEQAPLDPAEARRNLALLGG